MISVGTDILKFERLEETLDRLGDRFVERILTPQEQQEFALSKRPSNLLAKRFAAKEAVAKCLGTGIGRGVSWQNIRITHDEQGAPGVELSGEALRVAQARGGTQVLLSLADETDCVIAFAALT
jgi:holo-[acyl-carrier protein] synthase